MARTLTNSALAIIIVFILTGCSAVQYGGDIIRSGQKDFEAAYTPGFTKTDVAMLNNPVLAVNGMNSNGQSIIGFLSSGSTNSNVYTDMFMMELMKKGIMINTLTQGTKDAVKNQNFKTLDSLGNQMVLIVNTNLATSSSITDATTGGEWAKVGITSFTIKGVRTSDSKMLFLGSGTYGKAKDAGEVAKDIAFIMDNIYKGNLEKIKDPD